MVGQRGDGKGRELRKRTEDYVVFRLACNFSLSTSTSASPPTAGKLLTRDSVISHSESGGTFVVIEVHSESSESFVVNRCFLSRFSSGSPKSRSCGVVSANASSRLSPPATATTRAVRGFIPSSILVRVVHRTISTPVVIPGSTVSTCINGSPAFRARSTAGKMTEVLDIITDTAASRPAMKSLGEWEFSRSCGHQGNRTEDSFHNPWFLYHHDGVGDRHGRRCNRKGKYHEQAGTQRWNANTLDDLRRVDREIPSIDKGDSEARHTNKGIRTRIPSETTVAGKQFGERKKD